MGIVTLRAKIRLEGAQAAERGLRSVQFEFRRTGDAARQAGISTSGLSSTLGFIGGQAQRAAGGLGQLTGLLGLAGGGLAVAAFQASSRMDALTRGLTTVATKADPVTAQLTRLQEVAKLPGLSFEEAVRGSVNLQAAGLNARLAERSITAFGNALASAGKGSADLQGVITALSQIVSKGTVSAEEINQIAERVPQIRRLLSQAFGTADTEQIQKLGLTGEAAIERIVAAAERLPQAAGGIGTLIENIGDRFQRAILPLGNGIARLLEKAAPSIDKLLGKFEGVARAIGSVLERLGEMGALNRMIEGLADLLDENRVRQFFAGIAAGLSVLVQNLPAILAAIPRMVMGGIASAVTGTPAAPTASAVDKYGKFGDPPKVISAGFLPSLPGMMPDQEAARIDAEAAKADARMKAQRDDAKRNADSLSELWTKMSVEFAQTYQFLLGKSGATPGSPEAKQTAQNLVDAYWDRQTMRSPEVMARAIDPNAYLRMRGAGGMSDSDLLAMLQAQRLGVPYQRRDTGLRRGNTSIEEEVQRIADKSYGRINGLRNR